MRDLNTNLVADAMLRGRRSVYVDYVDYDAVAHHAGIMQPESLAALEGIDAVLAQLEAVAAVAPRKYHLVVLSDHGQSQGRSSPTGTARTWPRWSGGCRTRRTVASETTPRAAAR